MSNIQVPGEFTVRDLLASKQLLVTGWPFQLTVPAGSLRVIEAVQSGQ